MQTVGALLGGKLGGAEGLKERVGLEDLEGLADGGSVMGRLDGPSEGKKEGRSEGETTVGAKVVGAGVDRTKSVGEPVTGLLVLGAPFVGVPDGLLCCKFQKC